MASGQNHVIELNHLHHVSLETMDTGAIYVHSINWLSGHGVVIRHNFIHDVIGRSGKAGQWRRPYFAWGIYLDWTAMGVHRQRQHRRAHAARAAFISTTGATT